MISPSIHAVPSVADELRSVNLGDRRREKRLRAVAEVWSAAPDRCVPSASKSSAMTEATYRLLNNEQVTYSAIADAHARETRDRVARAKTAIVAHDTSNFSYQGEVKRKGLGRLRTRSEQGFLAHVALAISADGEKRPLGVLGFAPWVRTGSPRRKKKNGTKRSAADYAKDQNKESERWAKMVKSVEAPVGDEASLIHVMDREADDYPLLAMLKGEDCRFVVRLYKNRVVSAENGQEPLKRALERVKGICQREVPLSRRKKTTIPGRSKTFPGRDARIAKLQFGATTIEVKKPKYLKNVPPSLKLNIVRVREIEVPEDVDPVQWTLVTSEPIETEADLMAVVDIYRTRWLVEELFKALKTGCAIEKRQHESLHALLNATAICLPIAWQMLLMRTLARNAPESPATDALTPTQVEVLKVCSPIKLGPNPTVKEALSAVAALGGHLKNNGDPGWLVLGRGMDYVLALERGWLARDRATAEKSDR